MRPHASAITAAMAASLAVFSLAAGQPDGLFRDASRETGLVFRHHSGATGDEHLPEVVGPGAALADIDNDGDLDVYLVQGGTFGPEGVPRMATSPPGLFRNDLGADGRVRFVNITASAGLRPAGYAMGVAAGDFDNDGWVDLFETGYGSTRLLRNVGGQRFEDVTAAAGASDTGFSVSAAFVDYDRDGWLDLFVARYVDYTNVRCILPTGRRDYCGPRSFTPLADRLLHNVGGRFEDASALLVGARPGAGLGVVSADLNGDGFQDLYVANDGSDNHLWINRNGAGFREEGLLSGVALNALGLAEAGMGVDAGDVDGDGDLDLFVTNLTGETNTLYVNDGKFFEDRTIAAGLAAPSLTLTSFGTRFVDYDGDGLLDLPIVSGAVHVTDATPTPTTPADLAQPKLLFRNVGGGRFADVTPSAGPGFSVPETSRGLGVGDIDNDGHPDLVVANDDGQARLLLNAGSAGANWAGLRLVTRDGRRDAYGAVVTMRRPGASAVVRHVHADGSYASSSDPRVLLGLGRDGTSGPLIVRWPDGQVERFDAPPVNRYTTVRQGTGAPAGP